MLFVIMNKYYFIKEYEGVMLLCIFMFRVLFSLCHLKLKSYVVKAVIDIAHSKILFSK